MGTGKTANKELFNSRGTYELHLSLGVQGGVRLREQGPRNSSQPSQYRNPSAQPPIKQYYSDMLQEMVKNHQIMQVTSIIHEEYNLFLLGWSGTKVLA